MNCPDCGSDNLTLACDQPSYYDLPIDPDDHRSDVTTAINNNRIFDLCDPHYENSPVNYRVFCNCGWGHEWSDEQHEQPTMAEIRDVLKPESAA